MATVFAKPEPRFGARLGAGGLEVVNLFAWRATDPAALHTVPRPGRRPQRPVHPPDLQRTWPDHGRRMGLGRPAAGPLEDDRQMTITLEVDLIVKTYSSLS